MIIIGILLLLLVSFIVSAYITFHKFTIRRFSARVAVFLILAVIISVFTFTVSLLVYYT